MHFRFVDANGNQISLIEAGQEFYFEAHVYSGQIIPESSWVGQKPTSPIRFTADWDKNLARAVGKPVVTELYNGELLRLVERDGSYSLQTDIVSPTVEQKGTGIRAAFDHFALSTRAGEETRLFRQKMIAVEPGTLDLDASDVFFRGEWMHAGSVHLESAELRIVDSSNYVPELDVNQDGRITAIDALSLINELNSKPHAESEATAEWLSSRKHKDVDRDGRVTTMDLLRVINWLNINWLNEKPKD